jgi:AN1-type zinc finger and ubiquitin domain-containing protein 1
MLLDPVDLNAFSKESAVIGGSDMCKIDDDSDVAGASSVDDKTRACTTVSAGESGPCDIGVDATMAAAAADVASVLSFTADELPCPPAVRSTASQKVVVDSGARASSARLRSSPEPFLDAKTNFASAVASALGETAATQRSTTLKMSTGGRGGGGNGSVVLRSLNSREMRAMSGILSTIVRGHSKGIVPRGSGTVVSACRLSDVTGTATSLKPAKETPGRIVDQTEPVNVLSRKLPAVQDGQPFDSPTLPCNIPPSSAVSVVESITAKTMTKRCTTCGKKTRLATSFSCRCGGNFCSVHRYAEVHGCTFDYKSEGRRLLEQSNPLVTAAKLPKI